MLLNFCLGCKKKKLNSSLNDENESIGNQSKSSNKSNSNKLSNKNQITINKTNDQLDYQATSPSSNCKFNNCINDQLNDQQTPIHNINTDGSIRIKTNAINRALPDIPINNNNDLINTSLNSNGSAIINRSIDRSLTPPSTTSFNITNLSINQSAHSNSLNESNLNKFNSCLTTTTFNPLNTNNLLPLHNNLSESQSQCLNELIDDDNQSSKFLNSKQEQKHHSYARIKDNNVVDSSTENDTDDYYDSTIVAKRGLDLQKVTIKVPSANQSQQQQQNNIHQQTNLNSSLNNEPTTSLYAVSGNLNNLNRIQPNLEMPYHISNISTINNTNNNNNFMNTTNNYTSTNNYDLSADEEPIATKEVSYNKISVREPLSKVLAERAAAANALVEHHYTEVYDENNSFYEEIAGSTNSSVTYTKIGDLQITNSNQNQSNSIPINIQQRQTNSIHLPSTSSPIPIETSLLTIRNSSRSTSPMQNVPILQTFLPNNNLSQMPSTSSQQQPINCEALYSQINKSTKKNDKYLIAQQQQPPNINDLYAKVQKNLKVQNHSLQDDNRKIHSSTPDMNNLILNNNNLINKEKPPPLPPFHPKPNNLFSIKSNSNLNNQETNYQHYNQLNVYPQHKRSFSSSSQYQDNDSDYYETFPSSSNVTNKLLLDNHNYEVVKKKKNNNQFDDKEIVDAGYEIINYATTSSKNKIDKESDEDSPCYETIPSESKQDEYISEPDYEIIQHKPSNKLSINNLEDNNKLIRKESDLTDPGYEQLIKKDSEKRPKTTDYSGMNYTNQHNQNNESNKDYEVVNNGNNHFIERL